MQHTAIELKDKLLRALDKDNNVVDMSTVLEVISKLEKFPITREALEITRLGRTINDLRRKTDNKDLARRSKTLVRQWHKHLLPHSSTPSSTASVNGERVAAGSGAGPPPPGGPSPPSGIPPSVQQKLGAAARASSSRSASPAAGSPASTKSNVSPCLPASRGGGNSGLAGASSRPATPANLQQQSSKLSPKPLLGRPGAGGKSKPVNPANGHPGQTTTNIASGHGGGGGDSADVQTATPNTKCVSKTNAANKRKRRLQADADTPICDTPVKKIASDNNNKGGVHKVKLKEGEKVVNGLIPGTHGLVGHEPQTYNTSTPRTKDTAASTTMPSFATKRNASLSIKTDALGVAESSSSSLSKLERTSSSDNLIKKEALGLSRTPSFSRTPKVKPTAELIHDLYKSGNLRLTGSATVKKIALNQIEREPDNQSTSIVPAEAKPRPRRKPGTQVSPPSYHAGKTLSETKNEMVHKFLQSSVTPPLMTPSSSEVDLTSLLLLESQTESPDVTGSAEVSLDGSHDRSATKTPPALRDSVLPPGMTEEEQRYASDPWSFLPTLSDLDEITFDYTYEEPPVVKEVTEGDVDRVVSERWEGVNGMYDGNKDWCDWTRTYSAPTYGGDLLHVLPYVDVNIHKDDNDDGGTSDHGDE